MTTTLRCTSSSLFGLNWIAGLAELPTLFIFTVLLCILYRLSRLSFVHTCQALKWIEFSSSSAAWAMLAVHWRDTVCGVSVLCRTKADGTELNGTERNAADAIWLLNAGTQWSRARCLWYKHMKCFLTRPQPYRRSRPLWYSTIRARVGEFFCTPLSCGWQWKPQKVKITAK